MDYEFWTAITLLIGGLMLLSTPAQLNPENPMTMTDRLQKAWKIAIRIYKGILLLLGFWALASIIFHAITGLHLTGFHITGP